MQEASFHYLLGHIFQLTETGSTELRNVMHDYPSLGEEEEEAAAYIFGYTWMY